MTTNDATRTALRSEDGMWERFDEEERIKQEMAAMGKANDATPREADRGVLESDADMTLAYMKGWQDGQDAMRKSVDAAVAKAKGASDDV